MARREHASTAELASGLGLGALEAARVAARSAANRAALLQADALPALVGLLKARAPWPRVQSVRRRPWDSDTSMPWCMFAPSSLQMQGVGFASYISELA